MKKKWLLVSFLWVFSLLVTACGSGEEKDQGVKEESDKIVLGGIGGLTGEVAVYGVSSFNGAQIAIDEINETGGINSKQIVLKLEDDKGVTTESINAYNKLRDEGVVAIIGSITSAPTEAIAPLAQEDKMPLITPTGTQFGITMGRDGVFRVCFTDPFQGEILAQYAKDSGAKTAALMKNSSSDYSSGVYDAFKAKAEELGIEIVAEESYGNDDMDFRVQLTNIKSANPDVLLVPDYYQINALIAIQANELGIDAMILGPDGWDGVIQQVEPSQYDVLNKVYFTNHYSLDDTDERVQNFIKNYRDRFGEDPTAFAALSYDAVYLYKQAIEEANSTEAEAILTALNKIEFEGITGKLKFDENNNPVKSVSIISIKDGKYTLSDVVEPK